MTFTVSGTKALQYRSPGTCQLRAVTLSGSKRLRATSVPLRTQNQVRSREPIKQLREFCFFPGSQWMAAIVLMITNNADPQCLHSGKPLRETVPFIEQVIPSQMAKPELWNINRLAGMPSPRLYSTHLPADGFPQSIWQKAQMIYMYRNPKDVAVLMHHWLRGLEAVQYNHEIPYFVEQLTDGLPKRPAWYGPLL
ncbi:hypothetical protein RvY_04007-2 [Ramazzottius varieornatus]|uniref:Sulfotransferase domain-containing protein n=1 Tax=Ramazzottius varieornatus TaxID=947166 RepID=A0A1D1UQ23_RAMVA|nr:hypothetical protein RvY_04007-2 [Ramazzottius varieornatus]